jgi:hypothetical protein
MLMLTLELGKHVLGNANALDDILGTTCGPYWEKTSYGNFSGGGWDGNDAVWTEPDDLANGNFQVLCWCVCWDRPVSFGML